MKVDPNETDNVEKFVNDLHNTIWTKATQEYTAVNNKKISQVYKEPPYHIPFTIPKKNRIHALIFLLLALENTNPAKKEDRKEDMRSKHLTFFISLGREDEETIVNEKTINEHKERVKKMKQQSEDPHLKNTLGLAATIKNNKKENLFLRKGPQDDATEAKIPELPDFREIIKMRVERVSQSMKKPYKEYEEYLYKKLTKHEETVPEKKVGSHALKKAKFSAPVLGFK